tara:strand:+ start:281 stop:601 length:321 start_codon:yes stop_codon:yes gene_type:complete
MITFIKSLTELMIVTQSMDTCLQKSDHNKFNDITEDSGQRKRYIRSKDDKAIDLPNLPRINRSKWAKSKEAVSKFFDELDYNNQIQKSYDLTLLARQNKIDHKDAA